MERLKIVLGLGNPGKRYEATRHNLGFRVLDRLAASQGASFTVENDRSACWIAEFSRPHPLVLAKPRTFMNRSGLAASELCERYAVRPSEMLVVYDDVDLELGRLRIRRSGSAGGHNGLRSLIAALDSEEIPRVRLGVLGGDRGQSELADYVLAAFDREEEAVAETLVGRAAESVQTILADGLTVAMNRYNARSVRPIESTDDSHEEG